MVGYYPINKGGAEYQAWLISNYLKEKHEIFYISIGHEQEEIIKNHNIVIYKLKSPLRGMYFLLTNKIFKILNKEKPDVIYQRIGFSATGIAAIFCKKSKCRLNTKLVFHIAHDRDVSISSRLPFHRFYLYPEKVLMQYGIRRADSIIAQTNYQDELLQSNYKLQATAIIPNGHPVPRDCIKSEHIIRVLWVANMKPIKQPEIFIKLVRALSGSPNVSFIMIGRTKGYQDLVIDATECGIDVLGEISNEEVNELLEKSHILINTSQQEGFSNTFIQAWLRRVPVVSLHVDPDGILNNKELGFCSGNFNQLVKDTKQLIADKSLRENKGARAREYAIAHHSLDNLKKTMEIITS